MSAHLMPNLARQIEFLREASRAPRPQWESFVLAQRSVPLVSYEGGTAAMALSASARVLIKQLPDLRPEAEGPARELLKRLADVLQCEFDARFEPPFYVKGET